MKIETENFLIDCDSFNLTLYKKSIVQEHRLAKAENVGKVKYSLCGYYSDFSSLVRGCIKHSVEDDTVKDLEGLNSKIESIAEEFRGIKPKLIKNEI